MNGPAHPIRGSGTVQHDPVPIRRTVLARSPGEADSQQGVDGDDGTPGDRGAGADTAGRHAGAMPAQGLV